MALRIGKPAPEFAGKAYVRGKDKPQEITLKDFRGRWVTLFFYPADYSAVCPTELEALAQLEREFEKEKCALVGCSTDSFYSHKNWFETDKRLAGANFPIVADKTHEISRIYEVLNEETGEAMRSFFLIDDQGNLAYHQAGVNRVGYDINGVLTTLKAIRTGKLCPANWKPGEKTIN